MDTEGTLTKLFQSVFNYASALIPPALTDSSIICLTYNYVSEGGRISSTFLHSSG